MAHGPLVIPGACATAFLQYYSRRDMIMMMARVIRYGRRDSDRNRQTTTRLVVLIQSKFTEPTL